MIRKYYWYMGDDYARITVEIEHTVRGDAVVAAWYRGIDISGVFYADDIIAAFNAGGMNPAPIDTEKE